jgi:hypothetical protein
MSWPDDLAFPGRPEHGDFWRLSDFVLRLDGATEDIAGRSGYEEVLDDRLKGIDRESVVYMAQQRSLIVVSRMGLAGDEALMISTMIATGWIEGFLAARSLESQ